MPSDRQRALEKAQALDEKVRRHNDIAAMTKLAKMLLYSRHFTSERERGVQLLIRAVEQARDYHAMVELGYYLLDHGRKLDHSLGVSFLERSLKLREDAGVVCKLGQCYSFGRGVPKDVNVAVQLFERSLRRKPHPQTMCLLADALLNAPHLFAQRKRAIELRKEAIPLSLDPARKMTDLARLYHFGAPNLEVCPSRASKWYLRAIRKYDLPFAKFLLAALLWQTDRSDQNVKRALQLLEDAMEQEQAKELTTILNLAEIYKVSGVDPQRALHLYENASIRFNSREAVDALYCIYADGLGDVPVDYGRLYAFLVEDVLKNNDEDSFFLLAQMMWTGAGSFRMDPERAIQRFYPDRHHLSRGSPLFLMLRFYDQITCPDGEKRAQYWMNKFNENLDRSSMSWIDSIILSESACERDRALCLESFQNQVAEEFSRVLTCWLPLFLRRSPYNLPFDGHLHCITKATRRLARWNHVASLNLASLQLEIEGMQQEAVSVLEDVMNSSLRLIAMLNTAFILMNDIRGVTQNWARGMQLLEDAVNETNDVSARVMLANALSQRPTADGGDLERGWKLWQGVEQEEEEGEELCKLRRLVSASSKEKWDALAATHDVEMSFDGE
ncbi:hypothetical protein FGB62_145g06 [Gracilaria domingensis]|nr:hypothetical protein FGB62_145g06 [Gracilaria domingensis]